jgi:ribose/xylose/arabinose/galactoside ABC-type transport system permease subunit
MRRRLQRVLPLVVLGAIALAMLSLPLYHEGTTASTFNVYNDLQSFASLGLLALAVGLTVIAGEFDLSTVGMYGLGAMLAVTFGADSPLLGIVVALAAAVVVGLVQGGIITRFEISSVPVTLGGYITLIGVTSVISDGESVAYGNFDAGIWLDQTVATFFSPRSLIALGLFVAVGVFLRTSHVGRDLRAVGGDRRAARAAGVRTDRVLIGVFVTSACLSALAGALLSYSVATALPDVGVTPLIFAVTAALIGGVSLSGGQGTAFGIAVGALALGLLQELFAILASPDYVANLVQGALLLLVVAVDAPDLRRRIVVLHTRMSSRKEPAPTVEARVTP